MDLLKRGVTLSCNGFYANMYLNLAEKLRRKERGLGTLNARERAVFIKCSCIVGILPEQAECRRFCWSVDFHIEAIFPW